MNEPNLPAKPEEIIVPNSPSLGSREKLLKFGAIHAQSFSGPLPPPEILGKYETMCPGSADRIIAMAERESDHRRAIEQAIVRGELEQNERDSGEARCGQICALVITVVALGAGAYTAIHGHELAGSILGVGGIGSIVTAFLIGRARQQEAPPPPPKPEAASKPKKNKRPK